MLGSIVNNVIVLSQESLFGRIFGLDAQLQADACIQAVAVFLLFLLLSYLLFNPARELMAKRQEKIKNEMDEAKEKLDSATAMKEEYDSKIKNADKEVDEILSEGRRKALKREEEIVNEAKAEAVRIRKRTEKEIELEKNKVKDEVKQEMIGVAQVMAGKLIKASIDAETQEKLINEALDEMGDDTWQN